MNITIFVDDPNSWFTPWGKQLRDQIIERGHEAKLCHDKEDLTGGDIAFLIGCSQIIGQEHLDRYQHNLVCHPSDLPKGRGMSPLTWSILDGENDVVMTLFEAVMKMDAGPIYYQCTMKFEGHELNEELKHEQGVKTLELCLKFVDNYPNNPSRKQEGEPTFLARRGPKDSMLDMNKTIAEQFNLLRVVDNERYPAFFEHLGQKYVLKIEKG